MLVAIGFNNAGYLTEILRGGLQSISPQQRAAALSLGMHPWQAYSYVVLPQVLRIVFLPIIKSGYLGAPSHLTWHDHRAERSCRRDSNSTIADFPTI